MKRYAVLAVCVGSGLLVGVGLAAGAVPGSSGSGTTNPKNFAYIGYGASGALIPSRTSSNVSITPSVQPSGTELGFQCATLPFVPRTMSYSGSTTFYLRGDDNGMVEYYCPANATATFPT